MGIVILILTEARFLIIRHDLHPLIRLARISDLAALLRLEALFPGDRLTRRSFLHLLQHGHADVLVAVDTHDALRGNIVVLYRRNTISARLYSIIVATNARGQGLGRALMAAGERAAHDHGRASMILEVRNDNANAQLMYQRAGYNILGCFPNYYHDGATALRLRKSLLIG